MNQPLTEIYQMLDWFALLEIWQPKAGKQQKCIEGIKEGVKYDKSRMVNELGFSRLPKSCKLTLCIASVFLFLAALSFHINWFPVESLNLASPQVLGPLKYLPLGINQRMLPGCYTAVCKFYTWKWFIFVLIIARHALNFIQTRLFILRSSPCLFIYLFCVTCRFFFPSPKTNSRSKKDLGMWSVWKTHEWK